MGHHLETRYYYGELNIKRTCITRSDACPVRELEERMLSDFHHTTTTEPAFTGGQKPFEMSDKSLKYLRGAYCCNKSRQDSEIGIDLLNRKLVW